MPTNNFFPQTMCALGLHNTHIGTVGNELPEKDFFVRVESVDDQTHELRDLCLESERLHLRLVFHRHFCSLLLLLRVGHNSVEGTFQ